MSKQKVLTSFFVVFYSIYGIKKIYFKFFWNFFEKSLDKSARAAYNNKALYIT